VPPLVYGTPICYVVCDVGDDVVATSDEEIKLRVQSQKVAIRDHICENLKPIYFRCSFTIRAHVLHAFLSVLPR